MLRMWPLVLLTFFCEKAPADCISNTRSVQEKVDGATAVFSGKVISLSTCCENPDIPVAFLEAYHVLAKFKVQKVWKGMVFETIHVRTKNAISNGYDFKVGTNYLVFAFGNDSALKAHACSDTGPLSAWKKEGLKKIRGK